MACTRVYPIIYNYKITLDAFLNKTCHHRLHLVHFEACNVMISTIRGENNSILPGDGFLQLTDSIEQSLNMLYMTRDLHLPIVFHTNYFLTMNLA